MNKMQAFSALIAFGCMVAAAPALAQYEVYVDPSDATQGSVTSPASSPAVVGSSSDLLATSAAGYEFAYWEKIIGDLTIQQTNSASTRLFIGGTTNDVYSVVAHFTEKKYQLTATSSGTGSGTVKFSPVGGLYSSGTDVTLTAQPDASSAFALWSGGISGTVSPTSIIITNDIAVDAELAQFLFGLCMTILLMKY